MSRTGLSLVELVVASTLFWLGAAAAAGAFLASPAWLGRLADRSTLVQEVRLARLALIHDLAGAAAVVWQDGALSVSAPAGGSDVVFRARRAADGATVTGLERVVDGAATLVARDLTGIAAQQGDAGGVSVQLVFRRGNEWRRLVVVTGPAQ